MPSNDNTGEGGIQANREMPSADFVRKAAGDDLPPQLLWSLAYHESSFRPWLVNPTSHATGAWQITKPVLGDYNKAHGTTYALEDMKRPELAVVVAAWLLRRVISTWNASSVALKADFANPRFVSLLVLGWNSGPNAVLRLTKALEAAGVTPEAITVDLLHRAALEHGAPSWIAKADRVAWAKQVAATYDDLRAGRTVVLATLVRRPGGAREQKTVLEKQSGGAPAAPQNQSAANAARADNRATAGSRDPAVNDAAASANVPPPFAATESATSGMGEAVGAGLTLAVLGLGGAAAAHAAHDVQPSDEAPQ